jgi:hypothetical protein
MQKILQKLLSKLLIGLLFTSQAAYSQVISAEETLRKADVDFKGQRYEAAFVGYEAIVRQTKQYSESLLLKMAFIKERQNDVPAALYYLELYYAKKPDERVLQKIVTLAEANKMKGHKPTDIEYLFYLFHYYQLGIVVAFIAVIFIGGGLLFVRSRKGYEILFPYILLALFSILFLYIYNFGKPALRAIIKTNNALSMQAPSAGSEQFELIEKGTCVQVLEKKDIWYLVQWEDKRAYIRENNLWIIK